MLHQFFWHWTLKESYIKAVGIGLGFELERAEFHCVIDEGCKLQGKEVKSLSHTQREQLEITRTCATASILIDNLPRDEWLFDLEYLDDEHIVATARGPPQQATENYLAAVREVEVGGGFLDSNNLHKR